MTLGAIDVIAGLLILATIVKLVDELCTAGVLEIDAGLVRPAG